MYAENILSLINFNVENFGAIQTFFSTIIILSVILLIFWLVKDLSSRVENKYLRILLFIFIILGNAPGFLFYLVLRPRETIQEKSERQMLGKSQESILLTETIVVCPHCQTFNRRDFKFCTNCCTELNLNCPKCNGEIQYYWKFCPQCKEVITTVENPQKLNINTRELTYKFIDLLLNLLVKIIVTVGWAYRWVSSKLDFNVGKFNLQEAVISNGNMVTTFPKANEHVEIHHFEDSKENRGDHRKSNKKRRKRRKRK